MRSISVIIRIVNERHSGPKTVTEKYAEIGGQKSITGPVARIMMTLRNIIGSPFKLVKKRSVRVIELPETAIELPAEFHRFRAPKSSLDIVLLIETVSPIRGPSLAVLVRSYSTENSCKLHPASRK